MKEFFVIKQSNTYAEMLEAFGLAKLIFRLHGEDTEVTIESQYGRYKVCCNQDVTPELLEKFPYFPAIPFIQNKLETLAPEGAVIGIDFIDQKREHDTFKDRRKKIDENKNFNAAQKKEEKKRLEIERLNEFSKKLRPDFDVVRELVKNTSYPAYSKAFMNFHNNRESKKFTALLKNILNTYGNEEAQFRTVEKISLIKQITSLQLFAPHQGKGLNRAKANNSNMVNLSSSWVREAMKISGSLGLMICQYVKAGTGSDLKIYVPEIRQGNLHRWLYESHGENGILFNFKKYLKNGTPVKLDILNIINLIKLFIEKSPEFKGRVKECLEGLHSVYQKDLGQNKAVANISFIETPDFIEYSNQEEGTEWEEWLTNQALVIRGIEEKGDAIQGLQAYRNFLSGSNLDSFRSFCYWYSAYLMQALSNEKYWVRPFIIKDLNKIFQAMSKSDKPLRLIFENEGFQAVAQAIRQSTVNLQYKPKDARKFGIRYGLAQQLQVKSKAKSDLAKFIGDFISIYNSETARHIEDKLKVKTNLQKEDYPRANVNEVELNAFYLLLDEHPSHLVGALLAAYGFAKKNPPKGSDGDGQDQEDNQDFEE